MAIAPRISPSRVAEEERRGEKRKGRQREGREKKRIAARTRLRLYADI